ncbi:MAG: hypothetical protein QM756_39080 [Polyangiaceae bacterium]
MVTTTSQTPSKRDKAFVSLGTRFTVPVVLLVAAVAVGAYSGLVRSSRATAMRSKEVAGDMVVKLAALSVMPAVVFGDEVEMKRAVDESVAQPRGDRRRAVADRSSDRRRGGAFGQPPQ